MRRSVLFAGMLVLTSCSAIASFDGLVGDQPSAAQDGASPIDGSGVLDGSQQAKDGAGTSDGATTDGTMNAVDTGGSMNDAGGTLDTGTDGSYCATHPGHTYCDSFDVKPFASFWNVNQNNGSVTIDLFSKTTSAPGAVNAYSPSPVGTGENTIQHTYSAGSIFTIEADVFIEGTATSVDFLYLQVSGTSTDFNGCYIDISGSATQAPVLEVECHPIVPTDAGDYYASAGTGASVPTQYHRFKLAVNINNRSISATVDGANPADLSLPESITTLSSAQFAAGVGYLNTGSARVHVDDVTIDVTP